MTDLTRYRLSLAFAFVGALAVLANSWSDVVLAHFSQVNAPTFKHSAPDVREWPSHQYLPIG